MAPQLPVNKGPTSSSATPPKAAKGPTVIKGPASQSVGESRQAALANAAGRRLVKGTPTNAQPFNPVVGSPPVSIIPTPKPGLGRRPSPVGRTNTRQPLYSSKPIVSGGGTVAAAAARRLKNSNNTVVVHG